MQKSRVLTIGVLTYNRPGKLQELLEQLRRADVFSRFPVLVVDDGAEQATAAVAARFQDEPSFIFRRNESNRGYPRSLIRLVEECPTEYVLHVADDDLVGVDNLQALQEILAKETPDFACPMYLWHGAVFRGSASSRSIAPSEYFDCSAHASGLVYRTEAFKANIPRIAARLQSGKADATLFPQTIFAIATLLDGRKGIYANLISAFENDNSPLSFVTDSAGRHYWEYASQVQQFAAFDEFIETYPSKSNDDQRQMLSAHRSHYPHRLLCAWRELDPRAFADFERQLIWDHTKRTVGACLPRALKEVLRRLAR